MDYLRIMGDYLFLNVRVIPGASKSCILDIKGDKLRIRIAAAPEDGKANEELRSFLGKTLGIPKRDIVIVSGEKSRMKILKLPVSIKDKL